MSTTQKPRDGRPRLGYTKKELLLPRHEWMALLEADPPPYGSDLWKWVTWYQGWDQTSMLITDEERPLIRYGHYKGWSATQGGYI